MRDGIGLKQSMFEARKVEMPPTMRRGAENHLIS